MSNSTSVATSQEFLSSCVMPNRFSTQSLPHSVFSSCDSLAGSPRTEGSDDVFDNFSLHHEIYCPSDLELLRVTDDELHHVTTRLQRQAFTASIPIFLDTGGVSHLREEVDEHVDEPELMWRGTVGQAAAIPSDHDDQSHSLATAPNMSTSTNSSLSHPPERSYRTVFATSGSTAGSFSSTSSAEPPTPSDVSFLQVQREPRNVLELFSQTHAPDAISKKSSSNEDDCPSSASGHQRTGSETSDTSAFSVSMYYGSPDYFEEPALEATEELLSPRGDHLSATRMNLPCSSTPPTQWRPGTPPEEVAPSPGATPTQVDWACKMTSRQLKVLGKEYSWSSPSAPSGLATTPLADSSPHLMFSGDRSTDPTDQSSRGPDQHSASPETPIKIGVPANLAQRRGFQSHTPLVVQLPEQNNEHLPSVDTSRSSATVDPHRPENSSFSSSSTSPSTMCQIVQPNSFFPSNATKPDASQQSCGPQPNSEASPLTFPSLDRSVIHHHDSEELPVGELFRTLQIWFDQEGFREIAPIFTFSYYNQQDDLLYFSTERVGYPFHYDSMQHVPILRKVVAPDYEEAYALLEGKTHPDAAGRRDFISRQANLDLKAAGKYVVEDTEGRGGKWIWRLVYEVEERKSLMGRPMLGERSFIPITFACSPEVLDPSHARKPTLLNSIIKNMGSKKTAVALDSEGRPVVRPRGKSLIGYHPRKRSDSTVKLLSTPPRHASRSSPVSYEALSSPAASSSPTTSLKTNHDDELSRAQAHFFKAISPASASRLRPTTAFTDENSSKRSLRRTKTNEQLRRPFTADPARSALPARSLPPRPNITPVFGLAPQPSRATPATAGSRFNFRPRTADERRVNAAKSQLDLRRVAAASFFTPTTLSA